MNSLIEELRGNYAKPKGSPRFVNKMHFGPSRKEMLERSEALRLKCYEDFKMGMSKKQVAEKYGIDPGTASRNINRSARDQLR